jgi:hypothetical protein
VSRADDHRAHERRRPLTLQIIAATKPVRAVPSTPAAC